MSETAPQSIESPVTGIVDVTEAAARKMQEVLKDSTNQGIRVGIAGGGCAGLQYDLKPEAQAAEGDIVLEFFGVPFYINPMVVPYLKGTRIDYSNSLMEGGFKFINPNASSSCGCGTSFSIGI
ncbi:MAG TPA: iron-sulfur cluster assembly accessory protein [Coleofasciculaceae cyanobacterium]|jgi:iron-sulfur cluster assembly accessory protein